MLSIDLRGKRALIAGVADDGGFGWSIAKALAEAGATICAGTWPPALNIFKTMLERGKFDDSRKMSAVVQCSMPPGTAHGGSPESVSGPSSKASIICQPDLRGSCDVLDRPRPG